MAPEAPTKEMPKVEERELTPEKQANLDAKNIEEGRKNIEAMQANVREVHEAEAKDPKE